MLVRWRNPEERNPHAVCTTCGEIREGGVWVELETRDGRHLCPVTGGPHELRFVGGHGKAVRNVLLARMIPFAEWTERYGWNRLIPYARTIEGAGLLCQTPERTVRPFRGLRRA